ncbi:MAG: hypothetical protein L0211_00930 [Planctomycetaceae bacterium]|nr:hypothetical protein [Planctomycetaceae bacterium]
MQYVHAFVMLMVCVAGADGEQPKDAEVETIDAANRTVKLVGAGYTVTRKKNLVAKFVEVGPNQGSEIRLGFERSEAETTVQRNHASTIENLVFCSVSWRHERRAPASEIDFHGPQFEVIFSIPKDAPGRVSDFDRWYLVSIKLPEPNKESPRDTEQAHPGYGGGAGPIIVGPQSRAVELVGVRFRDGRQRDLLAKFAEFIPGGGFNRRQEVREIELGLREPSRATRDQTIADVTHTRTIFNIIESSVSSPPLPNPRLDETEWREPQFEVIFSIPQDAQGNVTDFTRWSLLSIKLPNAKKEQPKPSDK